MRTVQTSASVPLSSVKPLEGLLRYRRYCLEETRRVLRGSTQRRQRSPIGGAPLEFFGDVEGLRYVRCPDSGSLFLEELPASASWATLLHDVSRHRMSSEGFYPGLAQSRTDHVYTPKLEWIRETLRLQEVHQPIILEVATPPSTFTHLLKDSGMCADVLTVDEMTLAMGSDTGADRRCVHAAILLESLDRVDDPVALLQGVVNRLEAGGLLFVTALVCSGFDLAVLGLNNLYLYPPDRTNCFSLQGLSRVLTQAGLTLLEVSTPGVLDVEIVRAHLQHNPLLSLSCFERQLLDADRPTHEALQVFLQQQGLSSFARIVGRKPE